MILLVHQKACRVLKVIFNNKSLKVSVNPSKALWELAGKFPEEKLFWIEQGLEQSFNFGEAENRIHHDLVMASYAVCTKFLPERIGYVDQLPFINVNREVRYPTWRMSRDVGGIKGRTLLSFEEDLKGIASFDGLLNSIAKLGQQNGLFCYSDPQLIQGSKRHEKKPLARASDSELFSFVYSHYKTVWVFVLFFCLWRYENQIAIFPLFKSFFNRKLFGKQIDLPVLEDQMEFDTFYDRSVDVIIPTIGRKKFVHQFVEDLSKQSWVPKRVIIVEQDSDVASVSQLEDLIEKEWPFKIIHYFTHTTGACKARNVALKAVGSEWVFFADDDIRVEQGFLKHAIQEAQRLGVDCLNFNCKQVGEETVFEKIKQWGSFGSGTSMVKRKIAQKNTFSEAFDHGYGEDADYGMKLRHTGCDIIYHPNLEVVHLKAPIGGFRKKPEMEWEKESPRCKPSPTLMILAKKYYTPQQLLGFKVSLFLKFYKKNVKNPISYIKDMNQRWNSSESWAYKLSGDEE